MPKAKVIKMTDKVEAKELPLEARAIQCITDFKPPRTTQDTIDQLAAEFATAAILRTHAEKRYEAAKRQVTEDFPQYITEAREYASEAMMKAVSHVTGNDWQINFTANKPSLRTDIDELRTEPIKQGVHVTVIDDAINKVTKKATPAMIITAKLAV
jgi:kynurenine formamidase